MNKTTSKWIDTEDGGFVVTVEWEAKDRASATRDHGDETWTEWEPVDVEIIDEDGEVVSFFVPHEDEVVSELEKLVMEMIEGGEISHED